MTNAPIQHAGHSSLLARLQNRLQQGFGQTSRFGFGPKKKKEPPTRQVVVTNRWDDKAWQNAREMDLIDGAIQDLYVGDLDAIRRGEEDARLGYENAPELIRDIWQFLFKPYGQLRPREKLLKDAWLNRKILEELDSNPQFQLLRSKCATDAVSTTMATDAMMEAVREILTRKGDARDDSNERRRDPNGCQPGGKGGGKGQPGGEGGGNPGEGDGSESGGGKGGKSGKKPEKPEDDEAESDEKDENEGNEDEGDQDGDNEGDQDGKGDPEPDPDDWGGSGDGDEDDSDPKDQDGDDGDGGSPEDEGLIDDVERAWDEAQEEAQEREDNGRLAELLDEDSDSIIERALNRAVDEASDEVGELDKIRRGIGLEDGEWQMMDPAKRFEYAERFKTPAMRDLADIVGRMIRFAMGCQATKINDVQHEIYDVGNGNDITQVLSSELALLSEPESELVFFQRMVDGELLVYKKRGSELAGKGPIVIAIDKSGSMNGAPFNWAMAVSEALRRICADQDRDYYAMFFGNNNDRNRFWFPKGKPVESFDEVLAFLSCVANGGTQFDGVLEEALQRVQQQFDDEGKDKADIVFVTDGQANLDDEWIKRFNDERARIGCKMYSVFVGGAYDYGGYTSTMMDFLRRFSDEVIPISEFRPESVSGIFSRV